jgi:hypothetical protein
MLCNNMEAKATREQVLNKGREHVMGSQGEVVSELMRRTQHT